MLPSLYRIHVHTHLGLEHTQSALLKDAMKEFEQELKAEEQREQDKLQESMAALQEEKNRILAERKEKIKERVTQFSSDGGEQLLQSHNEDTHKLVNKIDAQKLRMQADLQDRINKRREGKLKMKELAIQNEMLVERQHMKEKEKLERRKLAKQETVRFESLQHVLEATLSVPEIATEDQKIADENVKVPVRTELPLSQQEITRLILETPLYHRLEHIKMVLTQGHLTHTTGRDGYIDPLDAQWTGDTTLHTLALTALSPRHFVVYKFGCCVMKSLETVCGYEPATLLLADKIPPNKSFHNNSFRNSFAFDARNKIIYIRLERLENVGEFLLVLVHTLAHIKAGSFESDSHHCFLREFFRALSLICSDLFLSKYREDSSVTSKLIMDTTNKSPQNILKSVFESTQSVLDKGNVVDGLLDTRVLVNNDIHGNEFTQERVMKRLQQYAEFQTGSKLREYLDELEAEKLSPPNSGGITRATQSLSTREKWRSVLRRVSRKKNQQDKHQYRQLLTAQVFDIEQRLGEIESEYRKAINERASIGRQIKELEAQLTETQVALQRPEDGSIPRREEVKNIYSRLSAARTEQVTFDLRINGYSKQMEEFKLQLKQKNDLLRD